MVDAVTTAANIQTRASSSSASLAQNFDTFLTLLTAQLQNQDPLEPVDSTEFTNQLVQFSGVEQQIETNKNIAELITLTANSQAASLAGYLGQTVEVNSLAASLGSEGIEWMYELPEGVKSATLSVQSDAGQIVYSEKMDATTGEGTFNWDGEASSGKTLESGNYALVIRALDADGVAMDVPVRVRARVNGIDLSTGSTAISTTAGAFDFTQVLRLTADA